MDSSSRSSNDTGFVNLHEGLPRYERCSAFSSAFPHRNKSMDFRKLILKLDKELSYQEFQDMKFLYGGEIKKRQMQKIATLMDLCIVLKERCLLSEDSVHCLVDVLQFVERTDLVGLVRNYITQYEVGYSSYSSSTNFAEQAELMSATHQEASAQLQFFNEEHVNGSSLEQNAHHENITVQQSAMTSDVERETTATRNQETQTDSVPEFDHLSNYNDKLLKLYMHELLLSGRFELFDHGQELSKLYMLRSEKGLKFLRSKLQRVYPQILYTDIYC